MVTWDLKQVTTRGPWEDSAAAAAGPSLWGYLFHFLIAMWRPDLPFGRPAQQWRHQRVALLRLWMKALEQRKRWRAHQKHRNEDSDHPKSTQKLQQIHALGFDDNLVGAKAWWIQPGRKWWYSSSKGWFQDPHAHKHVICWAAKAKFWTMPPPCRRYKGTAQKVRSFYQVNVIIYSRIVKGPMLMVRWCNMTQLPQNPKGAMILIDWSCINKVLQARLPKLRPGTVSWEVPTIFISLNAEAGRNGLSSLFSTQATGLWGCWSGDCCSRLMQFFCLTQRHIKEGLVQVWGKRGASRLGKWRCIRCLFAGVYITFCVHISVGTHV